MTRQTEQQGLLLLRKTQLRSVSARLLWQHGTAVKLCGQGGSMKAPAIRF